MLCLDEDTWLWYDCLADGFIFLFYGVSVFILFQHRIFRVLIYIFHYGYGVYVENFQKHRNKSKLIMSITVQ